MIVPLVLPLMAAALLLLVDGSQRRLRALINIAASLAGLVVAAILLWAVDHGGIGIYLAANWQAPFCIVLVADRLSVLMLLLVGVVSTAASLYAARSEEHPSELQSLMRISYAVFCLKKQTRMAFDDDINIHYIHTVHN